MNMGSFPEEVPGFIVWCFLVKPETELLKRRRSDDRRRAGSGVYIVVKSWAIEVFVVV